MILHYFGMVNHTFVEHSWPVSRREQGNYIKGSLTPTLRAGRHSGYRHYVKNIPSDIAKISIVFIYTQETQAKSLADCKANTKMLNFS